MGFVTWTLLWFIGVGSFAFLAVVPAALEVQLLVSCVIVLLLYLLCVLSPRWKDEAFGDMARIAIVFMGAFLSFRYMYWRATDSLPMQFGLVSMVLGLLLFLAELYGFINTLLGYLINIRPRFRTPVPLPADPVFLPHVDVYIPTYNEDPMITRATVIAATQMLYPKEKLHVYILDDGGTVQKCNDPDSEKAAQARSRADDLKAIADRYGAQYRTRERNMQAKAGNINSALKSTSGELLLILDCDHIPSRDFLQNTVGFFLEDPRLFLVQTPHNFVSPDPVEKNLDTYTISPAENELFYDVMQPGLDSWGTSFFCGSAAMLRRSVLDQLGGVAGQTITEDAETTLDAMGLGYSTGYFGRPMVSGLQPETYAGFIVQRVRWGQGMLQIFLLKNPLRLPGLTFMQRLLYVNFAFFWGFALSRLILLLAPPAFLLFSVNLCDATPMALIAYAGPALIASLITTQYFYGRVRWPFVSQLYEVVQSIYVSLGIFAVLRRPRSPAFKVTPKGEMLDRDFISSMAKPFYLLLVLNIAAIFYGIVRYQVDPWTRGAILFVEFWAVLDSILLLCALGITYERKQLRSAPRARHDEPVLLRRADGVVFSALTVEASAAGLCVALGPEMDKPADLVNGMCLEINFPARATSVQATLMNAHADRDGRWRLGLAYDFITVEDERLAIDVAFGSSEQLIRNNQKRHAGRSIIMSFIALLQFAALHGLDHLIHLLQQVIKIGYLRKR